MQSKSFLWITILLCITWYGAAFQIPQHPSTTAQLSKKCLIGPLNVFGGGKNKKVKEDLSYIETRDMSREEMLEFNRQSENVMNQELIGMTVFSLIISAPLLYLAWVGLFADTNEIASSL
jgi:hypothetical protein